MQKSFPESRLQLSSSVRDGQLRRARRRRLAGKFLHFRGNPFRLKTCLVLPESPSWQRIAPLFSVGGFRQRRRRRLRGLRWWARLSRLFSFVFVVAFFLPQKSRDLSSASLQMQGFGITRLKTNSCKSSARRQTQMSEKHRRCSWLRLLALPSRHDGRDSEAFSAPVVVCAEFSSENGRARRASLLCPFSKSVRTRRGASESGLQLRFQRREFTPSPVCTRRQWKSPFATKEREVLGASLSTLGGKPDDITVVIGVVR